jgi:hypothetical protein
MARESMATDAMSFPEVVDSNTITSPDILCAGYSF